MYSTIGLSMPTDYEMLVSHSPPIFNSYLSDYSAPRFGRDHIPRFARNSCRSLSANAFTISSKNCNNNMPAAPRRPCLVIRPEETIPTNDDDPTSPTRLKKKVVFADDRGMSLTHVRVMTEPSNVPPLLNSRFLAEVTQGLTADPVPKDSWEITFAQPASDYLEFRKKLERNKISLENVIIKEAEELLMGTVKVSNISFEKEVFVRSSFDNWVSNEDTFCQYVANSGASTPAIVLYDTFSFKFLLPPKGKFIEFCVCYRSEAGEFWDNNEGTNYKLVKKMHHVPPVKSFSSDELLKGKDDPKFSDALHAKVESWSQFASWNHLENSSPYW